MLQPLLMVLLTPGTAQPCLGEGWPPVVPMWGQKIQRHNPAVPRGAQECLTSHLAVIHLFISFHLSVSQGSSRFSLDLSVSQGNSHFSLPSCSKHVSNNGSAHVLVDLDLTLWTAPRSHPSPNAQAPLSAALSCLTSLDFLHFSTSCPEMTARLCCLSWCFHSKPWWRPTGLEFVWRAELGRGFWVEPTPCVILQPALSMGNLFPSGDHLLFWEICLGFSITRKSYGAAGERKAKEIGKGGEEQSRRLEGLGNTRISVSEIISEKVAFCPFFPLLQILDPTVSVLPWFISRASIKHMTTARGLLSCSHQLCGCLLASNLITGCWPWHSSAPLGTLTKSLHQNLIPVCLPILPWTHLSFSPHPHLSCPLIPCSFLACPLGVRTFLHPNVTFYTQFLQGTNKTDISK